MSIIYKTGDICIDYYNDKEALILQQNNCTAVLLHNNTLAYNLSQVFPYSNPYSDRKAGIYKNLAVIEDRPKPGSIQLRSLKNKPTICCLFAQYKMGGPNSTYYFNGKYVDNVYLNTPDGPEDRLKYFKLCLEQIVYLFQNQDPSVKDIRKIIIPQKIGCDAAKGNIQKYKKEIDNFANQIIRMNNNIYVYIIEYK